jgi:hypothetical protein
MMLTIVAEQAPVPPPAYHRAQVRLGPALHIDALTEVAHAASAHTLSPGPSSLPAALSGCAKRRTPHLSRGVEAFHLALARVVAAVLSRPAQLVSGLACLSPGVRLAAASGWPPTYSRVASQQWKRAARAGAPVCEALFVLSVLTALRRRLMAHAI